MNKKGGFTLIEVLIALVVFSIIAMGVYSLLNQSLYTENCAKERFNLILESTNYIYLNWNQPPQETIGWKETNTEGIFYKIDKIPLGFYNIVRVDWSFKKGNTEISYVFYY